MVEKEENWERLSDRNCSFTMRVMVGAIILYDHIDSTGAFCKESPIDIRSIVQLIKTQSKSQEVCNFLFSCWQRIKNAICFIHYGDMVFVIHFLIRHCIYAFC